MKLSDTPSLLLLSAAVSLEMVSQSTATTRYVSYTEEGAVSALIRLEVRKTHNKLGEPLVN